MLDFGLAVGKNYLARIATSVSMLRTTHTLNADLSQQINRPVGHLQTKRSKVVLQIDCQRHVANPFECHIVLGWRLAVGLNARMTS